MAQGLTSILTEVGTNELEVVEFWVDGRAYAINVAKVREIVRPVEPTPIPHAHPCVLGMFRHRDAVIPLVDLGQWLGSAAQPDPRRARIIVAEFNRMTVGFLVHGVERIHRTGWGALEPVEKGSLAASKAAVGILRLGENRDRILLLLDFETIVAEISPQEDAAAAVPLDERRRGKRVLVAEDSRAVRKLLCSRLEGAGYTVEAVADGQAAWERLQDPPRPDLVVSDIEMPRMDGHHLLRRIRADEALRRLPVVLYSSMIHEEMRRKGEALGATAQICKPDLPELLETVDRIVLEHP
ncbi:chemotaxis protein CheW [Deferrisoma sp.]